MQYIGGRNDVSTLSTFSTRHHTARLLLSIILYISLFCEFDYCSHRIVDVNFYKILRYVFQLSNLTTKSINLTVAVKLLPPHTGGFRKVFLEKSKRGDVI
eukprot:UN27930